MNLRDFSPFNFHEEVKQILESARPVATIVAAYWELQGYDGDTPEIPHWEVQVFTDSHASTKELYAYLHSANIDPLRSTDFRCRSLDHREWGMSEADLSGGVWRGERTICIVKQS